MSRLRFVECVFLTGLVILVSGSAFGQNYPNRPVRILAQAVGSANDFVARVIAQGLASNLGQPVIVDNRPVYTTLALMAAQAPPDGYTLLASGSSIWVLPLMQKMPYDPVKDFVPISLTGRSINVLVVHPSLPANSVKELIALARAKPGAFNFASGGTGATGHLTGELFKAMAGIDIVHVPYKGGSAAITDLIAGQVQMTFDNPSTVMPLAKTGKLRALAVTSAQPSELVPGLPTVGATLPGFESGTMSGLFAPSRTPQAIITQLNREVVRILSTSDVKEKYFNRTMEVAYGSPEEFAAMRRADTARWDKVIKGAGIRVD